MSNTNTIRRVFEEVWNSGKIAAIDEIFAADFTNHEAGNPFANEKGPTGYRKVVGMYREAFPDVKFTVEEIIEHGDKTTSRWTATATHKGPLMGIPATGKKATVGGIVINRFENGKIVEAWGNWDQLGLLQQIGVVPTMG